MGKHEAKVSRRKYYISITIAVILALIGGIVTGYFLARYISLRSVPQNTVPQPVVQQQQQTTQQEEPKKLTKDEQVNTVKTVLKSYFDINTATINKLVTDSLKESKTSGQSQEVVFKDKLYKLYQDILVDDVLDAIKTFIDEGNLKSSYYADYYKDQEGSQAKTVEVTDYHNNIITAKVTITDTADYTNVGPDVIPTGAVFFSTLKGAGITNAQYAKLVSLKPTNMSVLKTNSGTVTVEDKEDKWYMSSYDVSLTSTNITNVTINGAKMTLADFIKTYPVK